MPTLRRPNDQPRLVTPLFLLIMLATFAYFVSVGALVPTLPRFVKQVLGGSDAAVGLVIGSFAFSAIVLRPAVGRLGDTRGRRLLIVAGAGFVAVSVTAYTLAGSLTTLLLLRLVSGVGEAGFYVGAASVINDLAPDARRGEALSYFSLALYGGLAVGPVVGESVLELASFPTVWLVAGAFAVAAGILGLPVRDTRLEPAERPAGGRIVHPAGLMPGVVMACSVCGLAGFNTFVPLYALDIGLEGSRAVFVTYSVIVMLIRSFGARIPDVMGPRRAAPTALGVSGLGLWIMAAWPGSEGLYAGTALFAVGQALAFPALMTIAVEAAPASERAAVVGTFTAFFDLAFGGGAIGLGAVAEVFGYRGSFGVAGAVAAGGALLLLGRAQRRRQKATAQLRRAA
jgi:MFS family permease